MALLSSEETLKAIQQQGQASKPTAIAVLVPQPDDRGEFACPADGAKFMASFGIPQVPLSAPTDTKFGNPGKNPAINGKGWQNKATTDFAQIDVWAQQFPGCNFGSLAQAKLGGFYVLETDSAELAEKFQRETESDLFADLVIRSSAPGRNHRWYAQSAESLTELRNVGQLDEAGYSLRWDNEQCVSPGSVHKSGVQYAVVFGNKPTAQSATEITWLKAQIKSAPPVTAPATVTAGTEKHLIPKGGHHNALLSELGSLTSRGYSKESAEQALLLWAEENLDQPGHGESLSKHIHKMVESTSGWEEGDPAASIAYVGSSGVQAQPAVEDILPLVSVDGDSFINEKILPRKVLLRFKESKNPIFTAQSINQIFAWRGLGKTNVGFGLVQALATGGSLLNWEAPERCRVLYVEGELPAPQAQERWKQIIGGTDGYARLITIDKQPGNSIPSLASAIGMARVEKTLAALESEGFKTDVLFLDSISTLFNIKANDEEGWLTIQLWLMRLRSKGLCIFFFHHAGKSGLSRSHSKSEDMLDVSIKLEAPKEPEAGCLHVLMSYDKARAGYSEPLQEVKMHRVHRNCPCQQKTSVLGCPGDAVRWERKAPGDQKKFEAERRFQSGMDDTAIAKELDVLYSTVRKWRERWVKKQKAITIN